MPKPSDLLQGTLDLLILKTRLSPVSRFTVGVSLSAYKRFRATPWPWAKGPYTRRCTAWKIDAGSGRTGRSPIWDGRRESIL
jgi:hypothetical protein